MISRCNILTAQLFCLCILCLLGIKLVWFDFHAVFQQWHLSGIASTLPPGFSERSHEPLPGLIIPGLNIGGPCDIRIKTSRRPPDLCPELVCLNLLPQCLFQGRDRALIPAGIARGVHPELHKLGPRDVDISTSARCDPKLIRRIICFALCVNNPLTRNDPKLVTGVTLRIR